MKKTKKATRPIGMPNSRNSRAEAWRRLGIEDQSVLDTLPRVTRILASAKQGLPRVLLALRASKDPSAQAFVRKYDSVSPSDRRYRIGSNWDAIAVAAGLDPYRLLGVSVSALARQGETIGEIISASSHPYIVQRSVQNALRTRGVADRRNLLAARGFLPVPKGSTIIDRVQIANQNGSRTAELAKGDKRGLLPSTDEDLKLLHNSWLTENKLLPNG